MEFRVSLYYPNALIHVLGDPGSDRWDGMKNDTCTCKIIIIDMNNDDKIGSSSVCLVSFEFV